MNWREHIVSNPQNPSRQTVHQGPRISVALILGYLPPDAIQPPSKREFPDLTASDVAACLDYARDLAEFEAA